MTPRARRERPSDRLRALTDGVDWILAAVVAGILALSLFVIDSATREDIEGDPDFFVRRQVLYVAGGLILLVAAALIRIPALARWAWALWGGLLGSLAVVFVVGGAVRGSTRWIELGAFNLQPSEFGKLVLMVVLASLAVERLQQAGTVRFTLFLTAAAMVPALVIFAQPDLGTAIVYIVILAAILFLSGAPWSHFAVGGGALVVLVVMLLGILPAQGTSVLQDYQVERLTAFAGSDRDTGDAGYQLDQSKTAIGSGGAIGKGPDGATQTINDFLPEHHTDFIFAVTGEMFGFVGASALILLYGLLVWRGIRITARAGTPVEMLVAGAIVTMIVFQVFVNIGMTVGLMPITGIPLPLMSFGGSHTLTTLAAIGLLLGIHHRRAPGLA